MAMTMNSKILVLFANNYDMLNEKQQQLTGCSVHYLFWGEHGDLCMRQTEFNPMKPVGYQRAKASIAADLRSKIVIAPAIYDGTFEFTVGSDGKPVSKLVDASYICNVDFKEVYNSGFEVPGMVEPEGYMESIPGHPSFSSSSTPAVSAPASAKPADSKK